VIVKHLKIAIIIDTTGSIEMKSYKYQVNLIIDFALFSAKCLQEIVRDIKQNQEST